MWVNSLSCKTWFKKVKFKRIIRIKKFIYISLQYTIDKQYVLFVQENKVHSYFLSIKETNFYSYFIFITIYLQENQTHSIQTFQMKYTYGRKNQTIQSFEHIIYYLYYLQWYLTKENNLKNLITIVQSDLFQQEILKH